LLVHPQVRSVVFSLGPLASAGTAHVRRGLRRVHHARAATACGAASAGSTERDVDDMLMYGVLGVILGGRLGYVLFYKPEHYLRIRRRSCRSGRAA
jgi:phosphatidylglycerol:prolipoprotein diacylglycerol transferase